ncbi:hypothetical protein ASE01_13540 [Nocardioides sp. Root190]|uniref:hypothetical protein n=1 Tax=Nocardioides sp. Root190 TaxID=1736488 RepID=UPI0006FEAC56|nr:hypothetical protein [Nocardioides sp. Root190]KRB76054.1 hypothetical protein ASE01_13540 [Nocardioides sp. Root190]
MSRSPLPLSRRGLVAGGLAGTAALLGGCDAVGDLLDGDDEPGVSGAVTPTAPAVDADSALVSEVTQAIAATSALATATGTTVAALARIGTHLARIHDAHLVELGGADPAQAPVVPTDRATALKGLVLAEQRLQDRLVLAAGAARSGALAQVLASMAAAVAQQRAVM